MTPSPLHRFRAYPEGRSLYFNVYLWATLGEMRAYVRAVWDVRGKHAWAWTITDDAFCPHSGRKLPIVGEIHFARRYCLPEIVSHEVGHAAIAWAQRLGVPIVDGPEEDCGHEERFCYATGRLNRRIIGVLRRAGCWKE